MNDKSVSIDREVFSEDNICYFCNKQFKTAACRYYHKNTCEMYTTRSTEATAAKTNAKSAKKIAEAFKRKIKELESKLAVACKTAFELEVPNDRIDSKIIKLYLLIHLYWIMSMFCIIITRKNII